MRLTFVETETFTRRIVALGLEDALRRLQLELLANPEAGDVDPGTGGLRKVRIADSRHGKGTRGGGRVHYLWLTHRRLLYMLYVYAKAEVTTLTPEQKHDLRAVVASIKLAHGARE